MFTDSLTGTSDATPNKLFSSFLLCRRSHTRVRARTHSHTHTTFRLGPLLHTRSLFAVQYSLVVRVLEYERCAGASETRSQSRHVIEYIEMNSEMEGKERPYCPLCKKRLIITYVISEHLLVRTRPPTQSTTDIRVCAFFLGLFLAIVVI